MKSLFWTLGAAIVVGVAVASGTGTESRDAADDFEDAVVLGEEDLAERLEILRNQFRRMTPGNGAVVQDIGDVPAAWEEFFASWDAAAAERNLATWVVPFSSDRAGGDTVLRDGEGLNDVFEAVALHTSTNSPDSDGDGVDDATEYAAGLDPAASNVWWSVKTTNKWTNLCHQYLGDQTAWPSTPVRPDCVFRRHGQPPVDQRHFAQGDAVGTGGRRHHGGRQSSGLDAGRQGPF